MMEKPYKVMLMPPDSDVGFGRQPLAIVNASAKIVNSPAFVRGDLGAEAEVGGGQLR